ncbi:SigE family RNA polymerase sigma factor [Blastococcus sp. TF02-09]|uniref:SigE family RNA polymerase sigma factor n=1 Tax=Blastococcus sp. TF02-09 TaxID=2250576 RepID=UPI001F2E3D1C|nr:SigE family RNA polymerase sigma factor [Blastococcus sp. TF02-9]
MARLSEDDEAAFDAFVADRRASLLRTAFLLTGEPHRAEDLVQAALLEVLRRWPRLRDRVDPVGYARKTVVTTHLNLVRRLSWREVPVAAVPDDGGPGADEHDGTVQRLAIRAALLRLPPRMRAVLVLRYFDDLSEQDTAAALGCSQGAVKSSASRGLARLREVLDQHDLPDRRDPGVVAAPVPLPCPTPPGGRP